MVVVIGAMAATITAVVTAVNEEERRRKLFNDNSHFVSMLSTYFLL